MHWNGDPGAINLVPNAIRANMVSLHVKVGYLSVCTQINKREMKYHGFSKAHLSFSCLTIVIYISFLFFIMAHWRRGSSVDIFMAYGLNNRSSIPGNGKRFLSALRYYNLLWERSSLLSNGYRGLFLSPPSSVEVK
jgi:hypothetical protein